MYDGKQLPSAFLIKKSVLGCSRTKIAEVRYGRDCGVHRVSCKVPFHGGLNSRHASRGKEKLPVLHCEDTLHVEHESICVGTYFVFVGGTG